MDNSNLELYIVLTDGRQMLCKWKLGAINSHGAISELDYRMANNSAPSEPSVEELRQILLSNVHIADTQPNQQSLPGPQYGRGGYIPLHFRPRRQPLTPQNVNGSVSQAEAEPAPVRSRSVTPDAHLISPSLRVRLPPRVPIDLASFGSQVQQPPVGAVTLQSPEISHVQQYLREQQHTSTSQYINGFGSQIQQAERRGTNFTHVTPKGQHIPPHHRMKQHSRHESQWIPPQQRAPHQPMTSAYVAGFGNQIQQAGLAFTSPPAGHWFGPHMHPHLHHMQESAHRGLVSWGANQQHIPPPGHPVSSTPIQRSPEIEAFSAQCKYLDEMAAVVLPEVEISPEEIAEKQAFRQSLEDLCNEAMAATFKESNVALYLKPYGSLASGLALKGADMDLAITVTGKLPSAALKLLPRLLEWAILFGGHGARVIDKTRVPIIKVCEAPHAELYDALLGEREKWEKEQDEEILARGEWMGIPEVDIGSGTRTNDSTAQASAGSSTSPDQLALSYLHDFVTQERTDSDNVVLYNETFQRITRPLLQAGSLDLSTACGWYIDGLPPSTQAAVRKSKKFNVETPPPNGLEVLLNLAMSHSALLGLRATAGTLPKEPQPRERKRHALDFPSTGAGILCDINFSNELALHNTCLLYCYTLCDPRVRPMILLVKTWAKRRKINSPYDGTLSSYGYVLMVLHFLMNVVRPAILPNLQQHHYATHPGQHIFVQNWDVAFCDDEGYIRASAASGKLTENKDSLGVLLRNFFLYYAHSGHTSVAGGFNWTHTVLALRMTGGVLSKEWKGWTAARVTTTEDNVEVKQRYLFAIEDPFELDHNVARTVTHNGVVAIRNEFRRAWRILAAVGYGTRKEGDVFDELVFAGPETPKEGEASGGGTVVEGKGKAKVVDAETEEVEASGSGTVVEGKGKGKVVEEETEEVEASSSGTVVEGKGKAKAVEAETEDETASGSGTVVEGKGKTKEVEAENEA